MKRRTFLSLASLSALPLQLFAATRKPTPADQEGPFYPVDPIPVRDNLILNTQIPANETMQLTGRVLDQQGQPLTNAKIEIWQCDGAGVYDHPRQSNTEDFDRNFGGYGAQITNEQGYYQFTTLYPVPYTGRPPHIHIKLWHDDKELLTTQLYLEGNTGSSWFGSRDPLQIAPKKTTDGGLKAQYTFVV